MLYLLTTQQWTLILLAICVLPIAALIILAIILRIKNSVRKKESSEVAQEPNAEQQNLFLDAFGGADNFIGASQERIKVIVKVKDPDLIQGEKLQELGAKGVLIVGNEVRCSFGDRAEYVYKTLASVDKKESVEDKVNE